MLPVNGNLRRWMYHAAGGFQDGAFASTASSSIVLGRRLKAMPAHTQITHQACEEGWSFIAEWTGVRLSRVKPVGVDPRARFVVVPVDEF